MEASVSYFHQELKTDRCVCVCVCVRLGVRVSMSVQMCFCFSVSTWAYVKHAFMCTRGWQMTLKAENKWTDGFVHSASLVSAAQRLEV